MAANILVIVTGYGSITPKPWKTAYLNISEDNARQRFLKEHPGVRDAAVVSVKFDDEFTIGSHGEISSTHY
ncbi:hypothetical protein G8759_28870 [Spirosoma aureum]|uniref:Uncharacterized protein n=1 Tax=Spirosoma aureum TaxID=2692134 RepID=A0A6G9AVH3_9BACT|nr:hypothetical protein [Spirosoma aureum]QIP16368.1 hypothetical protein G8759_28870 [Spirosoma aureum]